MSTATTSYLGWNRFTNACDVSEPLVVFEPPASGTFPVFIYAVGTNTIVTEIEARYVARHMAQRGFVAAVMHYETNVLTTGCASLVQKADCSYSGARPSSATSVLCARPRANCARGILSAGFSQGGTMAVLARNFDTRVRAVWAMSVAGGVSTNAATACLVSAQTAIADDRMRIVNGRSGQTQPVSNLQNMTGTTCLDTDHSCLRANGSGWYMVEHAEVQDGLADHCFFVALTDGGTMPCNYFDESWDPGWAVPAQTPWSVNVSLDWLAGFADP